MHELVTVYEVWSLASMRPRLEAGECSRIRSVKSSLLLASMRPRLEAGECRSSDDKTRVNLMLQ